VLFNRRRNTPYVEYAFLTCSGRVCGVAPVLLSSSSPSLANRRRYRHQVSPAQAALSCQLANQRTTAAPLIFAPDAAALLCVYRFVTLRLGGR